jgi:RimJ/RimL family protein N-acetyltransferase
MKSDSAGPANGMMIETERLRLRPHGPGDFEASAALWANSSVTRHIGGRPSTREEAWRRFLSYAGHWTVLGFGFWLVEEKLTGKFVGEVGFGDFKREIEPPMGDMPEGGWVIMPWAHGRGYATEAAAAALAFGEARYGWTRTACIIEPENLASIRVAEKLGYRESATTTYKDSKLLVFHRDRGT